MALRSTTLTDSILPLAVVGVDFRRAPARQRDRLLLGAEERLDLAKELRRSDIADGLACLDTCNRTEWIASSAEPAWAAEVLRSQMIARDAGSATDLGPPGQDRGSMEAREQAGDAEGSRAEGSRAEGSRAEGSGADGSRAELSCSENDGAPIATLVPYLLTGKDAALHLMEVAAGLESFVLGEHEIAGQLQKALERSRAEQTSSPVLNGLGKAVGRLTRDTHRIQLTSGGPRGVHDVAVDYVMTSRPGASKVVVVGLGQIGERVARALRGAGLRPILCNRSPGVSWAKDTKVEPLEGLPALLSEADAAVICTAAPVPIVTERLLEGRKTPEPLLIVDLGIPAQVDGRLRPSIGECADLEVLQNASSRSLVASWADLAHVRQRVTQAVAELEAFCRERNLTQLLRSTQERHQRYIQVEIPRLLGAAFPELEQGLRAKLESELKGLVRDYTNGVFGDIKALFRSEED